MPVTNGDLYDGLHRHDRLYVVTRPPVSTEQAIVVTIDRRQAAAVLDAHAEEYPQQPRLSEIRSGAGDRWLLSGGALVTDHQGRIAVGLRDGNAADPFTVTNIGAGRCDRKLGDHCLDEFHAELILCVKLAGEEWTQVAFDSIAPDLACVRQRRPAIARWRPEVGACPRLLNPEAVSLTRAPGATTVRVEWRDGDRVDTEQVSGYALLDEQNHTLEFRLAIRLDLSVCEDVAVFYDEGTGYAMWKTPAQIRALVASQRSFGSTLVTPLLEALAGSE